MLLKWDETKAVRNLAKHGVSFEEASSIFGDPLSETSDDPGHSAEDQRFVIIGMSENGRMLMVAHTDDGEIIRIISARELTRREREAYEKTRS